MAGKRPTPDDPCPYLVGSVAEADTLDLNNGRRDLSTVREVERQRL